ncbi:hypothetical protein DFH27DRAFT_553547 [Peziza echinospora]|nr:hypothetical protein DFH27DRAFT_553547 [Peziza echinospora]
MAAYLSLASSFTQFTQCLFPLVENILPPIEILIIRTLHTLELLGAATVAGRTDLTTHPSPSPAAKHRGRLAERRILTGVSERLPSSTRPCSRFMGR